MKNVFLLGLFLISGAIQAESKLLAKVCDQSQDERIKYVLENDQLVKYTDYSNKIGRTINGRQVFGAQNVRDVIPTVKKGRASVLNIARANYVLRRTVVSGYLAEMDSSTAEAYGLDAEMPGYKNIGIYKLSNGTDAVIVYGELSGDSRVGDNEQWHAGEYLEEFCK